MIYETPLRKILVSYMDHYKKIDSKELRFIFTGIGTSECERIVDLCEELYGVYYDYMFFIESDVMGDYRDLYPYGCYYFFPYGDRDKTKKITKEEVDNIYWY